MMNLPPCVRLFWFFCFAILWGAPVFAEKPIDFNRDIRPILFNNCVSCHGPDEESRAADLRLDTEAGSREDLGGYAAIKPNAADESELMKRINSDDEDLRMPPEFKGKRLSDSEVQLFQKWINQGASYQKHWSYERPQRPDLPKVSNPSWVRNPIDAFVMEKLDLNQMRPSPEADRFTLARRLSIDLTGVPPTWEEANQFVHDESPDAYGNYVDRLLANPRYGIRWGRVWLDLARYADSAGYADDPQRVIWGYRDYVINSLNANKPFDQFTIEQIAGDLLENPSDEQLIATAFHRNTMTNNEGGTNNEEFRNVAIVDRVNTTMAVWMGTTMACAQCHTHKYDPITQEEYFQFFAFFNQSADNDLRDESPVHLVWTKDQIDLRESLQQRREQLDAKLNESSPSLEKEQAEYYEKLTNQPAWLPLVASAASAEHRPMKILDDGWIVAEGEKPATDVYSLEFPVHVNSQNTSDISALKIEVPASQQENFVLTQVTGSWMPAEPKQLMARYIRVSLPGESRILHLAEIEAFSDGENIAMKGTASQSSTDYAGLAKYANDGNTSGIYSDQSVTHTATEKDPWLEIDLGSARALDSVKLWNRSENDGIAGRLAGYSVELYDENRKLIWQQSPELLPLPSLAFDLSNSREIHFGASFADYEQKGFPVASLVEQKIDNTKGWAIAGMVGEPHELILVLNPKVTLAEGTISLKLHQTSIHDKHLLDRFRVSYTSDENISGWSSLPRSVQSIVSAKRELSTIELAALKSHFRNVAPSLAPFRQERETIEKQLSEMKPGLSVPIMRDLPAEKRRTTKIQLRGNYLSTGNEVSEATPTAFHPLKNRNEKRDRLDLAHWLVSDDNPLTPRVIANRHWEQIFGVGIVESSEEFGSQGELPSHPELLNWLAVELQENGWDIKAFIKLLVTSSAYRQSSVTTPEQQELDPLNRLLARGPRFRIDAEMIRDQALFVSGLLSEKMGGEPVNPPQPELGLNAAFGGRTDWKTSEGEDRFRAGIYTTWRRSSPYPSMAQFDAPNRDVCIVRRIRTNTPLQALVTLNDPVYIEAAQSLGRRAIASSDRSEERIQFVFQTCLTRDASEAEVKRLVALIDETYKDFLADPTSAMKLATDPIGKLSEGADVAEFATWAVVGNVILNLDEMLMKR